MPLPKLSELKLLCNFHHFMNILLSVSYIVSKLTPGICEKIHGDCSFDTREHEVLVFLGVIIVWKNRKAINWIDYLSKIYLFTKCANIFLFGRMDPLYGIVYALLCLVTMVFCPEPIPEESDRVIYFHDGRLQDELDRDKRVVWIVAYFASWSPECRHLIPVFSKLSERYTLPNLRFGKLDVTRFPKAAEHFRINNHPASRQLPTIALFREGEQVMRRPTVANKRAVPFTFTEENIILEFNLNNLHEECKRAKFVNKKKGE
uniref:Thioredoxin domain-containing protein n=1 Tax=Panagrolaimus sp. PS1159 TaxID=55785 RepID=A0AC35FKT9_9BILA